MSRIIISYPYGGFQNKKSFETHFLNILDTVKNYDETKKPIVIFNMDTSKRENNQDFLRGRWKKKADFEIVDMISSDTCVMWLRGWEEVIKWACKNNSDREDKLDNVRVILLPGDTQIKIKKKRENFIHKLEIFCNLKNDDIDKKYLEIKSNIDDIDIIIGDYDVEKDSAKELIDKHATYPFLAVWFPDFYKTIIKHKLKRPRSEFLNIKLATLMKFIIGPRKFGYEQTIKLLLSCWTNDDIYTFAKYHLGAVTDEKGFRALLGVVEQIERMERMMRLLWRDEITREIRTEYSGRPGLFGPTEDKSVHFRRILGSEWNREIRNLDDVPREEIFTEIVKLYEKFEMKSNLIRQNSIATIRAMLAWLQEV